jgi:hypothetical protein
MRRAAAAGIKSSDSNIRSNGSNNSFNFNKSSIPTVRRAETCRRSNISQSTIQFPRSHNSIPTVAINNFTIDRELFLAGAERGAFATVFASGFGRPPPPGVAALSCSAPSRGASRPFGFDRWRTKRATSSGDAQDCSCDPRGRIDG